MNSFRLLSVMVCGLEVLTACSSDDSTGGKSDAAPGAETDAGTKSDASPGAATDAGAKPDATPGAETDGAIKPDASGKSDGAFIDASDAAAIPATDAGPSPATDAGDGGADAGSTKTVLDLTDVKTNPTTYAFGDFKPNVQKLILSGTADSKHVAILWYTTANGGVALHYHAKTESVYVIDGTQTDAKGTYPTGTVYFNPPGSGHEITNSTGFFILAYAAPPDFADTNLIQPYTPIKIDTTAPDLTTAYPFVQKGSGIKAYVPPLDATGGLSAELIETTSTDDYAYTGNYVLVLKGSCGVDGVTYGKDIMIVGKTTTPEPYELTADGASTCLAMGVSF